MKRKASRSFSSRARKYARKYGPILADVATGSYGSAGLKALRMALTPTPRTPVMAGRKRPAPSTTPKNVRKQLFRTPQMPSVRKSPGIKNAKGRRIPRSAWGNTNSKSKGFFARSGRKTFNRLERIARTGVQWFKENGGILGSQTCQAVSIGHCCYKVDALRYLVCFAICRKIADILKLPLVNVESKISNLGFNYLIRIQYTTTLGAAPSQWNFTITGDSTLWQDMVTSLRTLLESANMNSPTSSFDFLWVHTSDLDPGAALAYADYDAYKLYDATVEFGVKSSMKLQNRTVQVTGGTAESVDNVPLYGKTYNTNGNFFFLRGGTTAAQNLSSTVVSMNDFTYSTCNYHGKEYNPAVTAEKPYIEPPGLNQTSRVKSMTGAHLDPGEVKTSILQDYRYMNLNKLLQIIATGQAAGAKTITYLGSARFFWFEKMIQSVANGPANFITLGYEIDEKYSMAIKLKKVNTSTPYVITNPV